MVKRKKNGLGILDDDKRNDDGLLSPPPIEACITSADNNMESPSTPNSLAKYRIHVTRTATKETLNVLENIEPETSGTVCVDKKILPIQRYSNRAQKRLKKEVTLSDISLKKTVSVLKQNAPLGSKTRRPWELWSVEDKNSFFEALCEYGKDFESIQSYIAQRSKKKGILANMIKNKDQVRHFYYRTWHKISKHLEIGDDVRKQTQEIYGLINYAELRKKIGGCLNEKNRQKLNELVFNGVTTVKYKGKKLRIKTPVCRALKKLNNVSESKEPEVEKLPKDIIVELRPQNNHAWLQVQNLAQNPRVRTKMPLQRRLKSVIEYMQNRWKPYRLKRKEQIMSNLSPLEDTSSTEDSPPLLRLRAALSESLVTSLSISVVDSASSSDVCLEKFLKASKECTSDKDTSAKKKSVRPRQRLLNEGEFSGKCESPVMKVSEADVLDTSVKDSERSLEDNYNINLLTPPKSVEEMEDASENAVDEAQRSLSLLSSMLDPVVDANGGAEAPSLKNSPEKIEENKAAPFDGSTLEEMYLNSCQGEMLTLGQMLSMGAGLRPISPDQDNTKNDDSDVIIINPVTLIDDDDRPVVVEEDIEGNKIGDNESMKDIKQGWTIETVGLMTIGELYLMLGRPSKIVLEYEFELPNTSKQKSDSEHKCDVELNPSTKALETELADVLRKLLLLASSSFMEFKSKQTPLSPTFRNMNLTRTNTTAQPLNKANTRCTTKSTNVKTTVRTTKLLLSKSPGDGANNSLCTAISMCAKGDELTNRSEMCSTTNAVNTICSDGIATTSDNHVFVMPVGTAPRIVKKTPQETLREEIDKLLPSTRRGCRVRRKPLVVQRPLLPRDGIGAGPRPMTLVHLVPSGSQLTAVIPTTCTGIDKNAVLPAKKVVKIISAGPAIDVRPLQVPLIPQPKSLSNTRLVVTPVTTSNVQTVDPRNVGSIINTMDKSHVIITTSTTGALPNMPDASSLSSPISLQKVQSLSSSDTLGIRDELIASSPPQISIPDTPCSSSTENVSSFIQIAMVDTAASKNMTETGDNILDFSENSTLSAFSLPSAKSSPTEQLSDNLPASENTPPQSPPNRPFRINSPGPEAQWLNGESGEFSLNTLLNTLESPCKVLSVSSSMNLNNDNSNSDPINRLAPVVDSQVRCLLEECSVDFIAKFEDLADVINSSNNDSKPA